uniref:Endoglucanase E1 n=2 Tax=Cajanus cajan TaxID=3821 RepID=A0A151U8X0_CAJCA|nr:Endoglucanase E1 [Cajanus cajan]
MVVTSFPLFTQNRWIVDEKGSRVKLACVNWVSHLEPIVAEGLGERPLDVIANEIKSMGFNCVRLTWPTFLVTNNSLASLTVRQSLKNFGLFQAIVGVQANNPSIIDLPLIKAYQAVVKGLGEKGVMVVLDNHVSKPQWCCSGNDGNGFFGDQYLDPEVWTTGLTNMATLFKGVTNVVAMSLRNELRGRTQNAKLWFRYMPRGAEVVHAANPDVLVILSGLSYDSDLSFLRNQGVKLSFDRKLVFELHWYAFFSGSAWILKNLNQVCGQVTQNMIERAGYLLEQGYPLFVSEFGRDLRGTNDNDNRYFNCFMAVAADLDFDWALWTLIGSYYLREGILGEIEVYGILNVNTTQVTDPSFLQRIAALQLPYQGPGLLEAEHKVIFHPLTGLCILIKSQQLVLGSCSNSEAWEYTIQKVLSLKGANSTCLLADGEGKQAKVGNECLGPNSIWEMISDSKLHLSSKINNASDVCLDVDANNNIVTNACKCLSDDKRCDPTSQWFKLVNNTRKSTSTLLY